MVFCMLQTHDGFLWFATKDGLNRYDGFEFKVFANDPFDPWSISENTVTALFEDSKGRLWAGTQNKGLNLYDARTQRFRHVVSLAGQKYGLPDNAVTSIVEDPAGGIWVVSKNQLLSCLHLPDLLPDQPDLGNSVSWLENPPRLVVTDRLEQRKVSCARLLRDGRLLLGNREGLYEIDWKNNAARPVTLHSVSPDLQGVFSILEDKNGTIWLGRTNAITLIKKDGLVTLHPAGANNIHNIELALAPSGQIWAYTLELIWQYSPEMASAPPPADVKPVYSGDKFVVNSLLIDFTGIVWCGTNGYGIRKFSPRMYDFANYVRDMGIWSVFEDRQSRVWIKVFFDYFLLDRATGAVSVPSFLQKSAKLQRALYQDRQNRIWLLAKVKDHSPQNRLSSFTTDFQPLSSIEFEANFSLESRLFEDHAGYLWMGAREGELLRFDPATQQFKKYHYGHLFPSDRASVETTTVTEDDQGVFWIGTKHGLVKGTPVGDSLRFALYANDPQNRNSLAHNFVLSVFPAPGTSPWVWVGTKGGLGRLDKTTGQFRFFTHKNGLPNDVVYGIVPDGPDVLWVSTNRGLSRISGVANAGQVAIRNYGTENGLPGMEFNTGAYCRSESGELLFGGVNGLTIFRPENLTVNRFAPMIHITGLQVNNHEIQPFDTTGILPMALEATEKITLGWDQNLLSIRFAATDYTAPGQNQYRYRLIGVDRNWVESGTKNIADYSQLQPGTYQFEVMGSNSDGVWSASVAQLTIVVRPPWWQSWGAYLTYFLLIACGFWVFYQDKIRRIRLENQLLFEKKEAVRLAEIDELKNRFFGNVTHEFRTPLALIIEPLRQVLPELRDPQVFEKVKLAEKNSRRLLHLVNQLLDIAKLESGKMELNLRKDDFREAVLLIYQSFLPLAERKKVQMQFEAADDLPECWFDRGRVELVVNNLVSNALKFTDEGGVVWIRLQADRADQTVTLQVADTGIGIPAAAIPHVFDRFYQVDSSNTRRVEGTGIGLALTKDLVKLMGGKIKVESPGKDGVQTVFTVHIPMGKATETSPAMVQQQPWPDQADGVERLPARDPVPKGQQPLLLIIEDNPEMRKFVIQSLPSSYQVMEAGDGQTGVRKALEFVPDLIISDVMMPEKDGYQVCDELKNNAVTSHIPIILLTAKTAMESKLTGLRSGADDYLTKPFHTEELIGRIENLIESRRLLRDKYAGQPAGARIDTTVFPEHDQKFLQNLTRILESNLDDDNLTVEDFAKRMFISRVQLHRKLKALTAQNATDFIRDYRLERAMELLKNKKGNVTQVAGMVGFGNEKYFSTVFKEKFGVSPSQVL